MSNSYSKPRFVREESWRYKRVKDPWRAPHGKTSRVRRSKKGWPARVKAGYSSPKATRGLHPSGLREILVHRPQEVMGLDPETVAVRIAHAVGENKRQRILEEANKANLTVLNPGPKKEPEAEAIVEAAEAPVEQPKPKEASEKPPETAKETQAARARKPRRKGAGKKHKARKSSK